MIQYLFLVIFFIDAGIHIVGVAKESKKIIYATKPFLMLLLALYFIFALPLNKVNWLILIAVLFGGAGDIFLMLEGDEKWFMLGMVAFLLGHIFYIIAFMLEIGDNIVSFPIWGLFFLIPVVLILVMTYPMFKNHLGDLKIPVHVYMLVILVMHIFTVLRVAAYDFFCVCFLLVWLGSLLFILSDSLIAIDTFNKEKKIPHGRIIIMLTYILGQFLIVQGVILSLLL